MIAFISKKRKYNTSYQYLIQIFFSRSASGPKGFKKRPKVAQIKK